MAELRDRGVIRSPHVEAAFLAVPRELFVGAVLAEKGVEHVYRDEALVTKRDARGMPLSSSSQPGLMAEMLELLDVAPGQRVLEIGAGTGYNAALISHIVGPGGSVRTVDVDPQLARDARRSLRAAGFRRVRVVVGDGRAGWGAQAPYDRIIVAAAADAVPRAWLEQLEEGGRLELPLRLDPDGAAIQVIPVFERRGKRLRSVGLTWGSFMPLHDGGGGWRVPHSTLSAGRTRRRRHSSLVSLSGAGLARLSDRRARGLLAELLLDRGRPIVRGTTVLGSSAPPMMMLYLLLAIPPARRVTMLHADRLATGLVDRRGRGIAVVSVPNPWRAASPGHKARRIRWRLDAYGEGDACEELEGLLGRWAGLRSKGRDRLGITASGDGDPLRLRFDF